jgi:hypothetical protein
VTMEFFGQLSRIAGPREFEQQAQGAFEQLGIALSQGNINRGRDQSERDFWSQIVSYVVEEADRSTFDMHHVMWPVCRAPLKELCENACVAATHARHKIGCNLIQGVH